MSYIKYTLDKITSRIVNGCYDNAGHAKRAIGRSSLSKEDRKEAHKVIREHFKEELKKTQPKPRKKPPKKETTTIIKKTDGKTVSLNVRFAKKVTISIVSD